MMQRFIEIDDTGVIKAFNMFKGCSQQEIYCRQGSGMIASVQFIGAANTTAPGRHRRLWADRLPIMPGTKRQNNRQIMA